MDIMITATHSSKHSESITLVVDGKTEARIAKGTTFDPRVNVCCKNSSHKVWRGCGRFFTDWQEALDGYKSATMKVAIRTARQWIETPAGQVA